MRLPVCLDLVLSHLVKEGLEMGENEFIRKFRSVPSSPVGFACTRPTGIDFKLLPAAFVCVNGTSWFLIQIAF